MKKMSLLLIIFFISSVHSQNIPEFDPLWSTDLKFHLKIAHHTSDGEVFLASDGKSLVGLDGKTGKKRWQKSFDSLASVKLFEHMAYFPELDIVACLSSKGGFCGIKGHTGELLWKTSFVPDKLDAEKYMDVLKSTSDSATHSFVAFLNDQILSIDMLDGHEIWSYPFPKKKINPSKIHTFKKNLDDRIMIEMEYPDRREFTCLRYSDGKWYYRFIGKDKPSTTRSSYFVINDRTVRLDALRAKGSFYFGSSNKAISLAESDTTLLVLFDSANVDAMWAKKFLVKTELDEEKLLAVKTNGKHIATVLDSLMVLDAVSGAFKWHRYYDDHDYSLSLSLTRHGYFGLSAYTMDDSALYYTDRNALVIRKVDLETGKNIWASPEFPKSQVFPVMTITKRGLLIQAGGLVEHRWVETKNTGVMFETNAYSNFEFRGDDPNLMLIDPEKGSFVWKGKIKPGEKYISNPVWNKDSTQIYVADSKIIYGFSTENGDTIFSWSALKLDLGNVQSMDLDSSNEKLYVFGEKGFAFIRLKDRNLYLREKLGKCTGKHFEIGKLFFVFKSYDEFVVIDKARNLILGSYKHNEEPYNFLDYVSKDGKSIFEKSSYTKVKMYRIIK